MPRKPTCLCGQCQKCRHREYMRAWYQSKSVEERREWISKRDPEKVKQADRARYYRDWAKRRAAADKYARRHPDKIVAGKKKWIADNPEKRRAHTIANNAIRDGKLQRQPCERADEGNCHGRVHKHHDDYSKPLDVRFFCARHHAEHHRGITSDDHDT